MKDVPSPESFRIFMNAVYNSYQFDHGTAHYLMDRYMILVLRLLGYNDGCDIFDKLLKDYQRKMEVEL